MNETPKVDPSEVGGGLTVTLPVPCTDPPYAPIRYPVPDPIFEPYPSPVQPTDAPLA